MRIRSIMILLVAGLMIVFSGCKKDDLPFLNKSKIVEITNDQEIGTVPEHLVDMELWDGKLLMGGYYWTNSDKQTKIYAHDLGGSGIYKWQTFQKGYESIYRIWVWNNAVLNISTEQPPEHWAREKVSGWGLQKHYGDKGWALLGDTLSNGKSVRGYSTAYRQWPGYVEILENGWQKLGNPVRGIDGSNRIVWCAEFYKGEYYVGTAWAENGGYHAHDCGNIYKLEGNDWKPIYGHEVGKPTGSVISCLVADDRIFFGTFSPQRVLIFDGSNWSDYFIGDKGEIAKIWKDNENHIFAGSYTQTKMAIHQWNLKDKKFEQIYETPINTAHFQWGVVGVCNGDNEMFVKYRDSDITRVKKLNYKES